MLTIDRCAACIALAGATLFGAIAYGASPADICAAGKIQTAGKYGLCRLKVEAKALKTGAVRDFAKCDRRFAAKWEQADGIGTCPTTGDEVVQQVELTANANRTAWKLSGQPRFVDNGDGTITDRQTGLDWEKKTEADGAANFANLHDANNSYVWAGTCTVNTGKSCQPTAAAAALCAAGAEGGTTGCDQCTGGDGTCDATDTVWTWAAALNGSSFAGHGDWRVPTLHELQEIVDYTVGTAPSVSAAFAGASCGVACTDICDPACSCTQPGSYWSASLYVPPPGGAWYVYFGDGSVNTAGFVFDDYVRGVRTGS